MSKPRARSSSLLVLQKCPRCMAANQSPWIMDSHVDGISVICLVVKTSQRGFQKVLQTVENTEKTGSLVVHFDGKFLHCHSILPTFSIGTLGEHYVSYVYIYIFIYLYILIYLCQCLSTPRHLSRDFQCNGDAPCGRCGTTFP